MTRHELLLKGLTSAHKLNGHVHTKLSLLYELPNLAYAGIKLNFACVHTLSM